MEISGEASLAGDDENIARRISQISFPTTNASTDTVSAGSSSSHAPCLSSVFSAPAPAIHETSTKSSAFSQEPSTPRHNLAVPSISPLKVGSPGVRSPTKSPVPPTPRPAFIAGSTLTVNNSTPRASRSPPNLPTASTAKRRSPTFAPEASHPSPAKKRVVGLGLKAAQDRGSPSRTTATPTKSALVAPSKTATRVNPSAPAAAAAPAATSKATATFRRPSGYFAQRRSLLPSAGAQIVAATTRSSSTNPSSKALQPEDVSSSKAVLPSSIQPPSPSKTSGLRPRASLPAISATVVKRATESLRGPRLSSLRPPIIKVNAPGEIDRIVELHEDEQNVNGDGIKEGDMDFEDVVRCSTAVTFY